MALETFEAGYAGARPPRTGAQWSGMWKLAQTTDRLIDGKWPSPWSVAGGNQTRSFAIAPGEQTPSDVQFNDDGTKFYIIGTTRDTVFQYSCATAWDVNTASYSSKSFYVGNQDTNPTGLFFKSDGTKFYIAGAVNDNIYQYSCSTAWDVSTASYDNKSFSVSAQETGPNALFFKSDGTEFYVLGTSFDRIFQYACSTAWDISTASVTVKSFSVAAQESAPTALFFKSDGTKFYITGQGSRIVYQYTCSTAWDVSTASYDSVSFSVSAQEASPSGLFFKSDGTIFYVVGAGSDTVFQYSCATAWDVSTASYGGKAFYVGTGQEGNPSDVQFNDDGTKFYIVGSINDTVYQYSCSTAWDISTASYDNKSFYIGTQETSPQALFFKSDGTKFYVVGSGTDTVYQYSCSTAWDISTASYDSKSFSVAAQETNPFGLFFKPDGTKFYIAGSTSDSVHQYTCSTAWDVSTASYDSVSFSVSAQETSPQALFFKSDGTKFYIVGSATDTVYQYSCSTAWDISTASYDSKSFSVAAQETNPFGLFFKPDGTKFYIAGSTSDSVHQYTCSTAWDVSTASYDSVSFSVSAQETSPQALFFKSDGTKFYIVGSATDTVYQYSCSTAWDISTASYDSKSFSVAAQESTPLGLFFKSDGTKFYIVGNATDTVYQYSCSTAWEMNATSTYDSKSFSVAAQEGTPTDVQFKDDGTKFYIVGSGTDTVYQYSCSTAWDVSTGSYDSKSFSVVTQDSLPHGLFFKSDGTKFYIIGQATDTVYQYSCATAWDVSTASYDTKSFSVAAQEGSPTGLFFKDDGTQFYIVGSGTDKVYQYSCSTAWDVSTASYDSKSFSVATQGADPQGLFFKSDGTKFYIVGNINYTVFQYSCSTAWDVSTASYDTKSFSVAAQDLSPNGLCFKSDGTKFYVVGNTNETVYQYSTVAAWEIQSPFYDSKFFRVLTEEPTPTGLFFKSDGTKFYIVGSTTDTVYQYSCSTAWDIGAGVYDNKSFRVAAQDTQPESLFFKPDGTNFYIAGGSNRTIYQYSCSTAWDVSTGAYDSKSFYFNAQETSIRALFFKDDGTKLYIVGVANDTVYQYGCSTAWDISTAFYESKLFTVNAQETNPQALFFKSDGTKFYIVGSTNKTVYQYSCATAWDVSTASYDGVLYSISTQDINPTDVQFKSDGTSFYVLGEYTDTIYQYLVLLQ